MEKANFILGKLSELFPTANVSLNFSSDFTCLVAVVLSAQCTDAVVNSVVEKLFKVAATPAEFIALGEQKLKEIIRPCGFSNTKARHILGTAKIILEKHSGHVPETFGELEALPGVGHKTASVVMSQCFGKAAFPVDTHIARLANRWGLEKSRNVKKIEMTLKKLFPESTWQTLHLQLISYGRKFCPARGHTIEKCPICLEFSCTVDKWAFQSA
ncbi:MAG: endonuclease III [Puniceicoccales bacterium]|jgi:endonuclease-3|nr:endonuclease III [Puniceicoccales bacterium]